MCKLEASVYLRFRIKSNLLKKDRKTTSDLKIAKGKLIDSNHLFSLAKVGNITFVVYSSIEIPSSSFLSGASCNQ